ncbi:c-type cytochrome [Ruegeria marina]|uniref:Cytochrome c553 n=1 Tax=Ruegeria marina TaxID=639004 RepID=A0A1G7FVV8_9RHOB|nr:c-type cytochrome [Ruegeria marina]SDE80017.1 Cytochrome c553 [Ruegeria marina]
MMGTSEGLTFAENKYPFWRCGLQRKEGCTLHKISCAIAFLLAVTVPEQGFSADKELGETRYKKSCISCHGKAGKGAASYPKISGNPVTYTIEKLRLYREGIKQGPNSALMIMMAKPLTDEEIDNLAAYLEDAE